MTTNDIIILIGLLAELLGAFVLAAEAIGLETLSRWIANLRQGRSEVTGERSPRRGTFLDPNRFIAATVAIAACWISWTMLPHLPSWTGKLPRIVLFSILAVLGGLCGVLVRFAIIAGLGAAVSNLLILQRRVAARAVGTLGFGTLAFGILLQMLGTALSHVS